MDYVTQKNAASAEESASASEELNAQAESMLDIVGELMTIIGGSAAATRMQAEHQALARKNRRDKHLALPIRKET